jgi:protein-S-isoprenylcysteine O-methyltransferase Ste14
MSLRMRISSLSRLHDLVSGLRGAPPGRGRIAIAAIYGLVCHAVFGVAVLAMIVAMFFGMSRSFGEVPQPWAWAANLALLIQFPLAHSFLLTRRGRALLERLAPAPHGRTLATTTYAIIASAQLLALFTLWTPPVWTPDQLLLAVGWTGYCLLAPRLKERRFERIYGDRFRAYRARVPYAAPLPRRRKTHG